MDLTVQALRRGVAEHQAGNLIAAEQFYRAILQTELRHPDANHNLGVLLASVGKEDVALPFLRTALEESPRQGQFWVSYIEALVKAKQTDVARQVLQQGKQIGLAGHAVTVLEHQLCQPDLLNDSKDPDHLVQAIEYREAGQYSEAEDWLRNWLVSNPKDSEAWSLLTQVYFLEKKDAEAKGALTIAASINPGLASVYRNQARLLLKQGNAEDALRAARTGYEISRNDPESRLVLAGCLSANQRDQEALALVENVLRDRPQSAEAFANRALIRFRGKDIAGALRDAELAISIKPHLKQLWGLL
jgi:tetratricopeptide (TPR) repeat protein